MYLNFCSSCRFLSSSISFLILVISFLISDSSFLAASACLISSYKAAYCFNVSWTTLWNRNCLIINLNVIPASFLAGPGILHPSLPASLVFDVPILFAFSLDFPSPKRNNFFTTLSIYDHTGITQDHTKSIQFVSMKLGYREYKRSSYCFHWRNKCGIVHSNK